MRDVMMLESPAGAHSTNRLEEWGTGLMMIGIAITLMISPRTIEGGSFRYLTLLFSPFTLAPFLLVFGALRIYALYWNGKMPVHGPRLRAVGAGVGAFLWFQMDLALILLTPTTGTVSMGVPVYAVLTALDVIACYRSVIDGPRIT